MTKFYLVSSLDEEYGEPLGLFSTEEKAQKFLTRVIKIDHGVSKSEEEEYFEIEENEYSISCLTLDEVPVRYMNKNSKKYQEAYSKINAEIKNINESFSDTDSEASKMEKITKIIQLSGQVS